MPIIISNVPTFFSLNASEQPANGGDVYFILVIALVLYVSVVVLTLAMDRIGK